MTMCHQSKSTLLSESITFFPARSHCLTIFDLPSYLGVYLLADLAGSIAFSMSQFVWIGGTIKAARNLHDRLATSILSTTFRFLDKTPTGRIIQRFTKDMGSVESSLSRNIYDIVQQTTDIVQRLIVVIWFVPAFLLPSLVFVIVGVVIGQVYIKAQLPIKRYC